MKDLIAVIAFLLFAVVSLLLLLNGMQRIIAYGDWPQGLCNLGIGLLMAAHVLGGMMDEE